MNQLFNYNAILKNFWQTFLKNSWFLTFYCLSIFSNDTRAQITPDGTVSTNVTTENSLNFTIERGNQVGNNLFHSFQEFSVPTGGEAFFNNALNVENIFSRVTGNSASNIDGLIRANGSANVFLINPNGMIFGPNARLAIGGSFVASTASSIVFADGTEFSSKTMPNTPLLTVSVPIGLQLGTGSGRIVVQNPDSSRRIDIPSRTIDRTQFEGFPTLPPAVIVNEALTRIGSVITLLPGSMSETGLQVRPGKTLALVGGEIAIEGGILTAGGMAIAPGGRIELGSVAAGSRVNLTAVGNGFALSYESATGFGQIRFSARSSINASGSSGGEIQVRGGNVMLSDTSVIIAATLGDALRDDYTSPIGEVSILAEQLNVESNSILGAFTVGTGKSASVNVETRNLTVHNGFIGSLSLRNPILGQLAPIPGDAGDLTIKAADSIDLFGTLFNSQLPSGIFAATGDAGKGGNITIATRQLTVRDGGQIAVTTGGMGKAGTVQINASNVQLVGVSSDGLFRSGVFASSFGRGDAGNLNVETQQFAVRNGAAFSAATRIGAGGTVTVKASDSVEVSGVASNPFAPNAQPFPSDISANTLGTGKAGDVVVQTGQLIVQNGGQVTAATRSSQGIGSAGDLIITAGSIRLDGGTITAETKTGDFGNITLEAESLQLRRGSRITTNATGTGGNITINTDAIAALENSDITANSQDSRGGQVNITTEGIFRQGFLATEVRREASPLTSDITATSQLGPQFDGIVNIQTPGVDSTLSIVELPQDFARLPIPQGCSANADRFVITGVGGVPPSPGDALHSDAFWDDLRPLEARNSTVAPHAPQQTRIPPEELVEATGWVVNEKGQVVLIANTPSVTPDDSWLMPANCYPLSRN